MKKIRLGVLGATRGLNYGISAKKCGLPVELAAVCDIFTPLMEKVRARLPELGLNPEYFSDFTEMLNKADIDAVVIANSANDHARFSIAALNAGKHVLSELLPVQTLSEAVALIEAVERSGKVYYYAENYCFWPGILEAVRLFREGMIGDLICGECDFVNDLAVKWRGDKYSLTVTYDLHTSLYWDRNLVFSNNVGTIRFLVGVNIFNGK